MDKSSNKFYSTKQAGMIRQMKTSRDGLGNWLLRATLYIIVLLIIGIYCYRILSHSTFEVIDNDQPIMWLAAANFSNFSFHEPCYYGQDYNTLLEGFLAVPLLWAKIPIPIAVPLVSCLLSIGSFLLLAAIAIRKKLYRIALVISFIPFLLPLEYWIISFMPRGFVPGIFLASIACYCLIIFKNKKGIFFWAFFSALAVTVTANAVIFIFPIGLYAVLNYYRKSSFYIVTVAGAISGSIYQIASYLFYRSNPEYIIHPSWPLTFSLSKLWDGLCHMDKHYEWVTPIFNHGSIVLIILFIILIAALIHRKKYKAAIVILSGFALMLITLGIPKVHDADYSVYFSYERFYLAAPHILAFGLILLYLDEKADLPLQADELKGATESGQPLKVTKKRKYLLFLAVTILVLFYMGYRHISLAAAAKIIMKESGLVLEQARVTDVVALCAELTKISARTGVELVVFLKRDTLLNYALAALHKGEIKTFSTYERRFWRLLEESENTRTGFLIYNIPRYRLRRTSRFPGRITTLQEKPVPIFLIENPQTDTVQVLLNMGFRIYELGRLIDKRKKDEISCSLRKN